jgi:VanZ family protein
LKLKPAYIHTALILFLIAIFIQSSIPGDELPEVGFEYADKIAHFIIYSILFILFFYSLKYQNKSIKLQKYAAEFALLFTAFYGMTDEIHQSFVPNRSSEFNDWLANVSGAIVMYLIVKYFKKPQGKKVLVLLFILFSCCKSSENVGNGIEFNMVKAEAWYNLMPGTGYDGNYFHFIIEAEAVSEAGLNQADFMVYNFQTGFKYGMDYFRKIEHSTLIRNDRNYVIAITDSKRENYLSGIRKDDLPDSVRFSFDIFLKGKKVSSINTNYIPIIKAY